MATQTPPDIQHIFDDIIKRLNRLEKGQSIMVQGLAANRPSSPKTAPLYYATNTKVLSIWNQTSASWNTVSFA